MAPTLTKLNRIRTYADCFDIVSDLMYRAVGVPAIEPISKVVSSIGMNRSSVYPGDILEELPSRKTLITPQQDIELKDL